MDHRTLLPPGSELAFPGMTCVVDRCVGRGSNAIVYEASYPDATVSRRTHYVLVKELFPYDPRGLVRREADLSLSRGPEGEELWQRHLESFYRGNDVHLQLLALYPEQVGRNINTFPLNNTLYTVLDNAGSRSLENELGDEPAPNIRRAALWCIQLLDCLEVFHRQHFLHLDIGPDNVLLSGEGDQERVLLTDYNSVHSREEIHRGEAVCFSAKEGFTAPEMQTGMYGDISFCTDLFSVAAVFYTSLTGSPPDMILLNRKTPPDAGESPLLADVSPAVREQVRKILRRGLCALPDKRYQSCAGMREDLKELLDRLDRQDALRPAPRDAGTEDADSPAQAAPAREDLPRSQARGQGEKAPFLPPGAPTGKKNARKKWTRFAATAAAVLVCAGAVFLRPLFSSGPAESAKTALPAGAPDPADPYHELFLETRASAEQGDPEALYGMGVLYEDGMGTKQDFMLARQYYLMAAEKNQPNAIFRLGILYQHGLGVDVSKYMAVTYYHKAADLGLTEAMLWLGELHLDGGFLTQSDRLAFSYFRSAWERGDPQGACRLADLYREGRGVEPSVPAAAELYQKAAEACWGPAAEALGDLYCDQSSGMADSAEAEKYYRMAVDLGQETAEEKLVRLREN